MKNPYQVIIISVAASLTSLLTIVVMDQKLYATDSTTTIITAPATAQTSVRSYNVTFGDMTKINQGTDCYIQGPAGGLQANSPLNIFQYYNMANTQPTTGQIIDANAYNTSFNNNAGGNSAWTPSSTNWNGWRYNMQSCINPAFPGTYVVTEVYFYIQYGKRKEIVAGTSGLTAFAVGTKVKCCPLTATVQVAYAPKTP